MRWGERLCLTSGLFLVMLFVLWSILITPRVLLLPEDLKQDVRYAGSITWYVDQQNLAPFPAGEEKTYPLTVTHDLASVTIGAPTKITTIQEDVGMFFGEQPQKIQYSSLYTLDRSTHQNVATNTSRAFTDANPVIRENTWYPALPREVTAAKTYSVWREELQQTQTAVFTAEQARDEATLYTYALGSKTLFLLPSEYCAVWGLPATVPFTTGALYLGQNVDLNLDGVVATLWPILLPEDQALVAQAQAQPIPTTYLMAPTQFDLQFEAQSGLFVSRGGVRETIYISLDYSVISGLASIFSKYSNDPRVGAYTQEVLQKMKTLGDALPAMVVAYAYAPEENSASANIRAATSWNRRVQLLVQTLPTTIAILGLALVLFWEMSCAARLVKQT